jgi:hypothetical protein
MIFETAYVDTKLQISLELGPLPESRRNLRVVQPTPVLCPEPGRYVVTASVSGIDLFGPQLDVGAFVEVRAKGLQTEIGHSSPGSAAIPVQPHLIEGGGELELGPEGARELDVVWTVEPVGTGGLDGSAPDYMG